MVFGGQYTWGSASLLQLLSVNTVPATLSLNMGGSIQRNFYGSAPINGAKTWLPVSDNNALEFKFAFNIGALPAPQTMPVDFISNDALFAGGIWTPLQTGEYLAKAVWNGTAWMLSFEQSATYQ